MVNKNIIITAIVSFIAGLSVYHVFLVDRQVTIPAIEEPEYDYLYCPDEENFDRFWNAWSTTYLTNNPNVDVDTQMNDWNTLMIENGCGEQWLNPLDDLIEDYQNSLPQ